MFREGKTGSRVFCTQEVMFKKIIINKKTTMINPLGISILMVRDC